MAREYMDQARRCQFEELEASQLTRGAQAPVGPPRRGLGGKPTNLEARKRQLAPPQVARKRQVAPPHVEGNPSRSVSHHNTPTHIPANQATTQEPACLRRRKNVPELQQWTKARIQSAPLKSLR